MKKICIALITLFAMLAFAHDPEPVATINIEDVSMKGAPVKFFGTADAYAEINPEALKDDRHPDIVAMTVEENNLQLQNVSDRTITRMIVMVMSTDVRGGHLVHIRHFSNNNKGYPPGYANKALATMKFPSGREHVMTFSKAIAEKEYQLKPYVQPRCQVYVAHVLFADGGEWTDTDKFDSLPENVRTEIRTNSWPDPNKHGH